MKGLNPAAAVIAKCGGVDAIAGFCGRSAVRVRMWTYAKDKGGTGGTIPSDLQQDLLTNARAAGFDLRPEDFFLNPAPPLAAPELGKAERAA